MVLCLWSSVKRFISQTKNRFKNKLIAYIVFHLEYLCSLLSAAYWKNSQIYIQNVVFLSDT